MQHVLPVSNRPARFRGSDFNVDEMTKSAAEASDFLKALAHESRLLILCLLIEKERTVLELEQILALRQSAVSQQLARLRADNLVEARRDGKNVRYSIARTEVTAIVGALYEAFCGR
jgi:ArsR family transcriptional regulator, virulence genes transcriptional regulator